MTTRRTRNTKKKRGPVKSKKVTYDGITFASGLERYMYQALKKNKIKSRYEGETFMKDRATVKVKWLTEVVNVYYL